jgi:hypothetical protein
VRACRGPVPRYGFAHLIEEGAQERGGLTIEHWRFPSYGAILPEPTQSGIHASYEGRKILRNAGEEGAWPRLFGAFGGWGGATPAGHFRGA